MVLFRCHTLIMCVVCLSFQYSRCFRPSVSRVSVRSVSSSSLYLQMKLEVEKLNTRIASQLQNGQMVIEALRGRQLNDDDQQVQGIDMKVVEISDSKTDQSDRLPLHYDFRQLERYFGRRPLAAGQRLWQVFSVSSSYLLGLASDLLAGNTENLEVRRAAQLRNTIVSLGPFFIKLGQALSIRPDILSPRAMVELQQLCDKVPSFDNTLAMNTIEEEFQRPVSEIFSEISPKPVAAASLGQVYQARLKATGELVAVKVQRPFVLETVSLDLYLMRQLGLFLRNFPKLTQRVDIVALLDQFANNFYQELDYRLECENGLRIREDMKKLQNVVIPKPYPEYCTRRVHVAQWITGEKLSQSKAKDVNALINLGVITYLTQLLETGLLHSDPHPGNLLRTNDGKLVLLDFGLMTQITEDQKYGMIEAIAHLIHRDYDQIGDDFKKLDFIPKEVDVQPLIPVLTRVFEAALAGGGAKSINFQELAADLAEITFKFPFRIPPYFALIIRAISVLEGIALVGNPEFAIVDEAYPFIAKKLLTDRSERARTALRYMIYGKSDRLDVERMIDILVALEKFITVKEYGDGASFKSQGVRGGVYVGKAGESVGTKTVVETLTVPITGDTTEVIPEVQEVAGFQNPMESTTAITKSSSSTSSSKSATASTARSTSVREALKFFFSDDGQILREFMFDEITNGIDAMSRDAFRQLLRRLQLLPATDSSSSRSSSRSGSRLSLPFAFFLAPASGLFNPFARSQERLTSVTEQFFDSLAPALTEKDEKLVEGLFKLLQFFAGAGNQPERGGGLMASMFPNLPTSSAEFAKALSSGFAVTPTTVAATTSSSPPPSQPSNQPATGNERIFFEALVNSVRDETKRKELVALLPTIRVFWPNIQEFLGQLNRKLLQKLSTRAINASFDVLFGPSSRS